MKELYHQRFISGLNKKNLETFKTFDAYYVCTEPFVQRVKLSHQLQPRAQKGKARPTSIISVTTS
jgi:hypothetical protein